MGHRRASEMKAFQESQDHKLKQALQGSLVGDEEAMERLQ